MQDIQWPESRQLIPMIFTETTSGPQIIKFCMTGDHLPVNVTDMDLHILRCQFTHIPLHTSFTLIAYYNTRHFSVSRKQLLTWRHIHHHWQREPQGDRHSGC